MKNCRLKRLFSCLAIVCILTVNSLASVTETDMVGTELQPRYTGIASLTADLVIGSSGYASCYGYVTPASGYRVYLTVSLEQDGDEIKSWSASGTGRFSIEEGIFVMQGYDYQVIVTAVVRNTSNVYITTYTAESNVVSY